MQNEVERPQRTQIPLWLILAGVTFAIHVVTSTRYGYFQDELYFIACAHHMAWGFVDQPPLVAVAAWLSGFFDYSLIALRALPILAASATVALSCLIAAELGGRRFAQLFAGIAVMLMPGSLLLGNTLTTTSFEPLSWTLVAYLLIRIIRTGNMRLWIGVAIAVAFGMYGKYSMSLLVATLLAALLCTRERRILFTPWLALGTALSLILLAPNLLWQFTHGWPMLSVLHGDVLYRHAFQSGLQLEHRELLRNAAAFVIEQVVYANPIVFPVWLTGLIALLALGPFARFRAFGIAYLILFALSIALSAKGYYIFGYYALLMSAGAAAIEYLLAERTMLRNVIGVAAIALTLPIVPFALPVLPIEAFIEYSAKLGLTGQNHTPHHVIQPLYAEEFGWSELAQRVALVYAALPPAQRAKTAIFADTFGPAAALDFYGPRYGLPLPISGQNNYFLWGVRGYDGSSMIAVGATQAGLLRREFGSVKLIATYSHPYRWILEGPTPIFLCTLPRKPLAQMWPEFQMYGT